MWRMGVGFVCVCLGWSAFALAVPACSSEAESCKTGQHCTTFDGCGDGAQCVAGACVKLSCVDDGGSCALNNAVCKSGLCSTPPGGEGVCTSGPLKEGWSCESSDECASGNCNGSTFVCTKPGSGSAGDPCSQNLECEDGLFCRPITCNGVTSTGSCSEPLDEDETCCNDQQCAKPLKCRVDNCSGGAARHCRALGAAGSTCCSGEDCQAGLACPIANVGMSACE